MKTERFEIKNRHGLKLVIQVDTPDDAKNLAFVAHGQSGSIREPHIQTFAEAYLENDFRVVRFDATNSLGESEGELINVTYTSYIEDLEDVIAWAEKQPWFIEPFALCGHSMGGQSASWYAEHNPERVMCLAAMAPVVNYELNTKHFDPQYLKEWQQNGYADLPSRSKPGLIKRLGWGVQESLKKYDILKNAGKLSMPVLDVVGEQDINCPPDDQRVFIEAVGSKNKKLIIIKGVQHSYRAPYGYDESKLAELKETISSWLCDITS